MMKRKKILIGGAILVCIALGIFAVAKFRGGGEKTADDESTDENVPTMVSVQTGELKRLTLRDYVNGYGTIEAAPATEGEPAAGGTLAASGAGVVAKVNVVAGQHVEKGDVLVELNSTVATFEYAKAEVERQKQLFEQQNASKKSLQDAQGQLASLEIVAPVSGTVTRLNAKVGQAVDAGTIIAEVIDLNRLAISAKISAASAENLKVGDTIEIASQPPVAASLSIVSPGIDPNDGTVSVWAKLPADSGLKPGQFLPLKIAAVIHTNCLVAPKESVVTDENGKSVIALVKGDEATQVPVETGLSENNWTEISGTNLNAGDKVVTVGAYGLPDKTQIKIVNPSADTTSATNSTDAQ